ncbi:senescence-specific cysteine protease SAG39-like isoform X2 [Arachis duranensis]|uniref:Vignain n=1 Tax=Arachis duranensis TaxID=130453 RepID=A0A6P4CLH7_ARADU|nr:senescence-specific cysteine protease SAG39-like isoform X2 [Arachis duranensis]
MTMMTTTSFIQFHQIIILFFLILTLWNSQVTMSRRLFESTCTRERHEKWMEEYGKVYKDGEEKERRFRIFKNNVEFIESFNAAGDKSFKLSVNRFADLSVEEFKASLNGLPKSHWQTTPFRHENVTDIPETVDWRKRGVVTPIKDQGTCGSWWAFSSVAAVEGIHKISTGKLVSLSVQELVDCVRGDGEGCYGGYMEDAYTFIAKNGGISSESDYPYKQVEKPCKANEKETIHNVAKIKGFEKVPSNNEKALLKAVAKQPVSVYLQASGYYFQFYSSGIFTGICETEPDHTATVVGYGKDKDGTKYWIVKNSWGTDWGEKGYIRMKREVHAKEGLCGIANNVTYPII